MFQYLSCAIAKLYKYWLPIYLPECTDMGAPTHLLVCSHVLVRPDLMWFSDKCWWNGIRYCGELFGCAVEGYWVCWLRESFASTSKSTFEFEKINCKILSAFLVLRVTDWHKLLHRSFCGGWFKFSIFIEFEGSITENLKKSIRYTFERG